MKHNVFAAIAVGGLLAIGPAACGTSEPRAPVAASTAIASPVVQPTIALPEPTELALPTAAAPPQDGFGPGVSGSGQVQTVREADLVFTVQGTVDRVLVEEGDVVGEGQLLAVLDTRRFDLDVERSEAALASAIAQQAALTEDSKTADIAAADAQVRQAQAQLDQVKAGPKEQDLANARAAVAATEANLQSTRDQLATAKVNAQLRIEQAANNLRNAQDQYSQIYWANRELEDFLANFGDELPQQNKDQEEAALRAVKNAETAVAQAQLAYEQAQQAEITGIHAVEQQLIQAQAALEKLELPPDADRLAAAEAALAQAQAARDRLNPDPRDSQMAQAEAGVAQAEAALDLAKLNREYAELHAPFDGVVSIVNVDPGDPSSTGGMPAIQIVDVNALRVEVQISDVDIARVAVGQTTTVIADALPGRQFAGTISYVAPTATVLGNVRIYLVRVDLEEQNELRAGMNVRVEIDADA